MSVLLDILSWILLLTGGAVAITAGVGLNRFPDVFSRMHAASMLDTLGAACILVGLILQASSVVIGIKLFMVLLFLAVTTTTAGHALVKSALASGEVPRDVNGRPLETVHVGGEVELNAETTGKTSPASEQEEPPSTH